MLAKAKFYLLNAATIFVLIFSADYSIAAEKTSNLDIRTTVTDTCSISSDPLVFGKYRTSILNSSFTVSVICTNGSNYSIGVDQDNIAGTGGSNYFMSNGNDKLQYALYQDPARKKLMGDASGSMISKVGTGKVQKITIYGSIKPDQDVPLGRYSDTINIFLTLGNSAIEFGQGQLSYQMAVSIRVLADKVTSGPAGESTPENTDTQDTGLGILGL